ncbi:MAG: hypothetical protein V3T70_04425 [Phycisphaerae bacterium]
MMQRRRALTLATLLLTVPLLEQPALASFHFMQIEQVIGGVNGDTSAQAIQLRMRSFGQNLVGAARIRAWDAAGANPVLIVNFTTSVPNGAAGRRILVTSANFNALTNPTASPDFAMTNLIPASYLAAGSLTFESNAGIIYWRLSWGGMGYTGSTTLNITNDVDGDAAPPYPNPLPTADQRALLFQGPFNAKSTTNAADYALTTGAAVFTNNATASFTVQVPVACSTCAGDVDGDNLADGDVAASFVNCFIGGDPNASGCGCADMDGSGAFEPSDVNDFVSKLLNDPVTACP